MQDADCPVNETNIAPNRSVVEMMDLSEDGPSSEAQVSPQANHRAQQDPVSSAAVVKSPARQMTYAEFKKRHFQKIHVDHERRKFIYCMEQGTAEWKKSRKYRLTASIFGSAAGHNKNQSVAATLKNLLWPTSFSTPATRKGNKMEQHVFDKILVFVEEHYRKLLPEDQRETNEAVWMENVGLYVKDEHSWLAASLDGILHVGGKQIGIEIKVPSTNTMDIIPTAYYDQTQGQMACKGLDEVWFVVDLCDRLNIRRFVFNQFYWDTHLYPALEYFYMDLYLPRLYLKKLGYITKGQIEPVILSELPHARPTKRGRQTSLAPVEAESPAKKQRQ